MATPVYPPLPPSTPLIPYITPYETTTPIKCQLIDMANRKGDKPFAREDNSIMDPRDFLKRVQHYLMVTMWDDEEKVIYFETWLKSGSAVEQWFKDLEPAKKATWRVLCTEFKG